jgi:hypothetical protein
MESQCNWKEYGQRENLSGKAVGLIFSPWSVFCSDVDETFLIVNGGNRHNRYNDDISLEDAIHTALLTLKEGFEGQMTEKTIEIGIVTVPTPAELEAGVIGGETTRPKPTFRKLTEEEVRDYLSL